MLLPAALFTLRAGVYLKRSAGLNLFVRAGMQLGSEVSIPTGRDSGWVLEVSNKIFVGRLHLQMPKTNPINAK